MITLQEFYRYIDELLQCGLFNDYCKNGVQVEGSKEIKKIATGVSASLETIEAAQKWGADALLVHHGLFWKNDSHAVIGTKKEKLKILLTHDISLLAYHLPLDAHHELGNNWKAAKEMGWTDLQPFGNFDGALIGVKGKFPKKDRVQLMRELEEYYGHSSHSALGGKEKVESAALISGGAYRSLGEAAQQKVDCFITGNFDEPAWHQAHEEGVNFFAMGHSATEKVGIRSLGEHVAKKYRLEHRFFEDKNPF